MNPLHTIYNLIGHGIATPLIPALWFRSRRDRQEMERFHQRLGRYPQSIRGNDAERPHIWLHAVSVGEAGVAQAIAGVLWNELPDCRIMLSAATRQGLARARTQWPTPGDVFYAPFDLPAPTQRAIQHFQPDVLAILETEIWPNLIITARRAGIRTALLNGRISVRTIRRYHLVRPLMRYTLSHLDALSMISEADAHRIVSLGAPHHKVAVHGNAKFDCPDPQADGERAKTWAADLFGLTAETPVFVAGSTREPEEGILLDAFLQIRKVFPEAVLIVAPRHTQRVPRVEQWIREKGLTSQRRTRLNAGTGFRSAPVVVLDTIGELSDAYSMARFVFCGGSLAPKGGQNLLEPALWAKPVMYGPSMEDFADAKQLVEDSGGGVQINGADELAALAIDWLKHPRKAEALGRASRRAVLSHRGAAQTHAAVVLRLLGRGKQCG
ncbi:MAG: 3-deoxy-D-manno-octulosonic acid transferase [Desulfatitalea sp.]|nr:hypothetical protein [Desulfatitalea sp.]NNJ99018.1 3-deoxy-D-manno-octulosonic acid transferase [Desulfatitalea sp.]